MKMDAKTEHGGIKFGRWHIWADEEQFILFDKLRIRKDGKPEADGHIYYLSSIESLFRRLYQQCIRDSLADCKDLGDLVGKAGEIAQGLEKVISHRLTFKMPPPDKTTG
jgi:hypothetical protein